MSSNASDEIKKICAIIEERDKRIFQAEQEIKYYTNAIETVRRETEQLQAVLETEMKAQMRLDEQLKLAQEIQNSVLGTQDVMQVSLTNQRALQRHLDKEAQIKMKESEDIQRDLSNKIQQVQIQLKKQPLLAQLEALKVQTLKNDILKRDIEVKTRIRKRILAQKAEIQKRRFYNYFVGLAEEYLTERLLEERRELEEEKRKLEKEMMEMEEAEVLMIENEGESITSAKDVEHVGPAKSNIEDDDFEKLLEESRAPAPLEKLLEENHNSAPNKVQILENKVIKPVFDMPIFVPPPKRKSSFKNLSQQLTNIYNRSRSTESLSQEINRSRSALVQAQTSETNNSANHKTKTVEISEHLENIFNNSITQDGLIELEQIEEKESLQQLSGQSQSKALQPDLLSGNVAKITSGTQSTAPSTQTAFDVPEEDLASANYPLKVNNIQEIIRAGKTMPLSQSQLMSKENKNVRFNLESMATTNDEQKEPVETTTSAYFKTPFNFGMSLNENLADHNTITSNDLNISDLPSDEQNQITDDERLMLSPGYEMSFENDQPTSVPLDAMSFRAMPFKKDQPGSEPFHVMSFGAGAQSNIFANVKSFFSFK